MIFDRILKGERKIDNYREKSRDWDLFTKLMLSSWVRIFDPQNEVALENARYFANQIEDEFKAANTIKTPVKLILLHSTK